MLYECKKKNIRRRYVKIITKDTIKLSVRVEIVNVDIKNDKEINIEEVLPRTRFLKSNKNLYFFVKVLKNIYKKIGICYT